MNHFILLIIIPFLTVMVEGPELCFDHDGGMHLTCCCKNDVSIKSPCCADNCSTIEIEVASMLTRVTSFETAEAGNEYDDSFEKFLSNTVFSQRLNVNDTFSCLDKFQRAPDIPEKLSTIILRC
jgi:hypothetical protein